MDIWYVQRWSLHSVAPLDNAILPPVASITGGHNNETVGYHSLMYKRDSLLHYMNTIKFQNKMKSPHEI
jgi:hypothetical protein